MSFSGAPVMNRMSSVTLPLAALSMLLLAGCSEEKAETAPMPRPVKVVEIAATDTGRELGYSGSLVARTEMNLGFRVGGKIVERLVDIGDRVTEGDVLARLDSADYQLALKSAEASLESASRQVDTAALALKRAEQLFASNVVARSQLEQATLASQQAVAARDAALSALEQAKNQVDYTSLKAAGNGIVTTLSADIGQVVGAGTPVLAVAIDGEKEVQIAVPETDIGNFSIGKPVKVGFWVNDMPDLDGTVREVAGSADPRSRTFPVRVSVPNDPRILLGMTANISTVSADGAALVSIPLAALARKDGDPIVWTVDPAAQTVHARSVRVAGFTDDGVSVAEGLAPGDIVIAAGTQFMAENMQVRLPALPSRQSAANETGAVLR